MPHRRYLSTMNSTPNIKHIALLFLMVGSIAHTHTESSQTPAEKDIVVQPEQDSKTESEQLQELQESLQLFQEQLNQESEVMALRLIKQLEAIQSILQDVALDIKNNNIVTRSRDNVSEKITTLISVINDVKQEASGLPTVDVTLIQDLSTFNYALMNHLESALKHGFDSANVFDAEEVKRNKPNTEVTIEDLDAKLAALGSQADSAGISAHNRIYRAFNDYLIPFNAQLQELQGKPVYPQFSLCPG